MLLLSKRIINAAYYILLLVCGTDNIERKLQYRPICTSAVKDKFLRELTLSPYKALIHSIVSRGMGVASRGMMSSVHAQSEITGKI